MPGRVAKNSLPILLMNGKELQKSYKVSNKRLKTVGFTEVLDNVIIEWK
jgi:hypothetical protein